MQQLQFVAPGTLEWREVPPPALATAVDALVRPMVVTTCDLDHAILHGTVPFPGPFAFGHEFVAEVVAVGDAVRSVAPGDRVIVPFQISCGACDRCRRGLTSSCQTVRPRAAYGLAPLGGEWGGAFSDLVRVPYADAMLVQVPAGARAAALACASDNLVDGWRTVGPWLEETPGADVLIVGGGARSIALYAVAIAKALGAGRVDYRDVDRDRLALAERLGASVAEGPPPARAGDYPITVDASADPAGLACALRSVSPYGVCTSVGIYFGDTAVPMLEMYTRGVRFVTGRVNARGDLPKVLALIAGGRLDPGVVTSAILPWEGVVDGLQADQTKPVFVRDPADARPHIGE